MQWWLIGLNKTKMRKEGAHGDLRRAESVTYPTQTVLLPNNYLFADCLLIGTQATLQTGLKTLELSNTELIKINTISSLLQIVN
jgi:hypothetical protein